MGTSVNTTISLILLLIYNVHGDANLNVLEEILSLEYQHEQNSHEIQHANAALNSNRPIFPPNDLFAIEIDDSDIGRIRNIADKQGFRIIKRIIRAYLGSIYHEDKPVHTVARVNWLVPVSRQSSKIKSFTQLHSFNNIYLAEKFERRKRRKRSTSADIVANLMKYHKVRWAEHLYPLIREKRRILASKSTEPLSNIELQPVWKRGITGKGVSIAILDDGVNHEHEDLQKQFSKDLSYNFLKDNWNPKPSSGTQNSHGTQCAGVVAMPLHGKCGNGIAPQVTLAGLKVLDEGSLIHDALEADALAYQTQNISIYSVSWGPKDDGKSMEGPKKLAKFALEKGIEQGRNGRGSLYIWASGNGGLEHDSCAYDGYASNLHTLTFGVSTSSFDVPWYSEGCAAVMAAVPEAMDGAMPTTSTGNECSRITGSSAAAPAAAGVLGLLLQTNPNLSQRDVQHLIVRTSNSEKLRKVRPELWQKNGADLHFSSYHGFGILSPEKLIEEGKNWKNVEKMSSCIEECENQNGAFSFGKPLVISHSMIACEGTSSEVSVLERVELRITVDHPRRGNVQIGLSSPSGTRLMMAPARKYDFSAEGFINWTFVAVGFWAETPKGVWTITISEQILVIRRALPRHPTWLRPN